MIPARIPFPPRTASRLLAAAVCVLGSLLAACDPQAQAPMPDSPPASSPVTATPAPAPANTSTNVPSAKPEGRVTIHYHRADADYAGTRLWTWDARVEKSPPSTDLALVGKDDFGVIFQLDRANYGSSDKIGFLPRLGYDWSHKDGGDRLWTPALGNEIWVISGKDIVFKKLPDVKPHVEGAYLDAPAAVVVFLSDTPPASARISILDQQNTEHPVQETTAPAGDGSCRLTVVPTEPLDVVNGRYRIQVDGFGPAVPIVPRGVLDDRTLFFDGDACLGAIYSPQSTTFRLFAPTAASVTLVLHDEATGGKGRTVQALKSQPKGIWETTLNGDLRGKFYAYALDGPGFDPKREALDPYAVNAVASSTRGRVTELPAPASAGPVLGSPTDAIVYEMHVRDFTIAANSGVKNRGLYLGFTEPDTRLPGDAQIRTALDHLVELGVTHVELLPTQDFADNETAPAYNWGYIPSAYFSPEGMYATNPNDDSRVREFKALVDALHARGIGVIMDVVYNHTSDNLPFNSFVPGYYYRHLADGSLADGSACGNELRTEGPMVRKLIVDSLKLWTKDYGIDGYRFDLMALIDQETMREVEHELRAINPGIILYGEPWTAATTPLQEKSDKTALRQLPVGAFNDDFRNALKGSPDGHDAGFIQDGSNREALKAALLVSNWFAAPGQSVNYMTCHDNLVLWDKLKLSMPGADDQTLEETMKLGYLALFTSQGIAFLHGGEEFARSKGGNNNSYDSPDAVNEVDWSLKRKHLGLFTYTRDLIALRKAHPVFRLHTREDIAARLKFENAPGPKTLMYTLDAAGVAGEAWKRVCVVLNSDGQAAAEITLPEGEWSVAIDEHGAAATDRAVTGKVSVRQKSGLVLYQK